MTLYSIVEENTDYGPDGVYSIWGSREAAETEIERILKDIEWSKREDFQIVEVELDKSNNGPIEFDFRQKSKE